MMASTRLESDGGAQKGSDGSSCLKEAAQRQEEPRGDGPLDQVVIRERQFSQEM